MTPECMCQELTGAHEFFTRSTQCLEEAHADFAPAEGMLTAAQQIAHVARTVDWFIEGAFAPTGFDLHFEQHMDECRAVTSLAEARDWLDKAFERARDAATTHSADEWSAPLPDGLIMPGAPRHAVIGAITDHSAHHRGALTVYSRLLGLEPPMPYMDM